MSDNRDLIRDELCTMLRTQNRPLPADDGVELRVINFRSLDFSELALRVEDRLGVDLQFGAITLRAVRTVGDVIEAIREMMP